MVEVPALNVNPTVFTVTAEAPDTNDTALEPKLIVLIAVPLD